jgi:hypothetical protein
MMPWGFWNDEGSSDIDTNQAQQEQQQQNRDEHRDARLIAANAIKGKYSKRDTRTPRMANTSNRPPSWSFRNPVPINGKWHEVTSILTAWSAFSKKDPEALFEWKPPETIMAGTCSGNTYTCQLTLVHRLGMLAALFATIGMQNKINVIKISSKCNQ